MGRQHEGMDRTGVRKVHEDSGKQRKMEETGCEVICCAPTTLMVAPAGSPSRGGNVAVYIFDVNQPRLSTPFYSVLVSISVFMALSTVFHSIKSPENSPLSHSVLPVLSLPYWSFHLSISLRKSPSALM